MACLEFYYLYSLIVLVCLDSLFLLLVDFVYTGYVLLFGFCVALCMLFGVVRRFVFAFRML